ncbi:MAG: hypothetical protein E7368_00880 [Clostridiales bacterium]|nr:hypothetical protein [Clostridiales bacterium]
MTFKDWIFSIHPENDGYNGQWQFPHILTFCLCIAIIVALTLLFRKKTKRSRETVLKVLVGVILFFEVARRVINFAKGDATDFHSTLYLLLPRPWCAISCWLLIIAGVFNKKSFWNFASINALLCAVIFFAYPSAGFNHKHLLFENIYSISTHALLLISSILILTLKVGDFRYKRETFKEGILKEIIMFAIVFVYGTLELPYFLDLSSDPLYFMPIDGNEVKEILGLGTAAYVIVYTLFLLLWVNAFYLIPMLWRKIFKKEVAVAEVEDAPKTEKTGRYLKTKGESKKQKNK